MTRPGDGNLAGSLRISEGKGIVRIEGSADASAADVWRALVDPERHGRWLGTFEGRLEAGGELRAHFLASEWEGTGRIEACEPERRLQVSLAQGGDADAHVMEVVLSATGRTTALVVEERGIPGEQLAAYGAGVQIHVEDLLSYLAGGARCDAVVRWKELFAVYSGKPIERR